MRCTPGHCSRPASFPSPSELLLVLSLIYQSKIVAFIHKNKCDITVDT